MSAFEVQVDSNYQVNPVLRLCVLAASAFGAGNPGCTGPWLLALCWIGCGGVSIAGCVSEDLASGTGIRSGLSGSIICRSSWGWQVCCLANDGDLHDL